jgi:hypothetical protein
MAHLKNFHKIVDIFVDRMFASRWDDERRSAAASHIAFGEVLAV